MNRSCRRAIFTNRESTFRFVALGELRKDHCVLWARSDRFGENCVAWVGRVAQLVPDKVEGKYYQYNCHARNRRSPWRKLQVLKGVRDHRSPAWRRWWYSEP